MLTLLPRISVLPPLIGANWLPAAQRHNGETNLCTKGGLTIASNLTSIKIMNACAQTYLALILFSISCVRTKCCTAREGRRTSGGRGGNLSMRGKKCVEGNWEGAGVFALNLHFSIEGFGG